MNKRPVAADDLYLLCTTSDPRISPDGRTVAWVLITQDRETDRPHTRIQLGSMAGDEVRDFTNGPGDSSPRWSPDGSRLAFVRAAEGAAPQLYLAPLNGGEPRRVTDLSGGVSEIAWSPDGARIAFVSRTGLPKPVAERSPQERNAPRVVTRINGRLDGRGWFEGRAHLFVLDIASGHTWQVTDGDWDHGQPSWSPDSANVVFTSDRGRRRHLTLFRSEIFVVPAKGGRPKQLTRAKGGATFPVYSPDGRWIAFTGDAVGDAFWNEQSGLWVIPSDGSTAPIRVAADLDREIGSPMPTGAAAAWLADSRRLVVLHADRGSVVLSLADVSGARSTPLLGGDRVIDGFSLSADGSTVAFSSSWFGSPHEIYTAPVKAKAAPRAISAVNEQARAELQLPQAQRVSHVTDDGLEIEAFLCLPAVGKGPFPLVLDIHGGPHAAHPLPTAPLTAAVLNAQGFAVVFPNPRGSSSYGRSFLQASYQDWGGKDYDDLMGCIDALVARKVADPERLFVQGYSYGGYMTSWVIGHTDRFRAAAVGAPVVDLVSMEGTSDIPGFLTHEFTGPVWEAPALLRERSPLTYLGNVTTPTLINHWEGDLRCPIGQSDQLFHALLTRGVDVVLVRYPGGAHGVRMPSQVIDRFQRISDWYLSH